MLLLNLVGALGALLATWALLWATLAGIGLVAQRLATGQRPSPADLGDGVWIGYAGTVLLLQLWHLVLPVTGWATVLLMVLGLTALFAHRDLVRQRWRVPSLPLAAAVLIVVGWIALRSLGELTLYDSGMYHIPFVEWAKAYPIVPGLGNLHGRLAFDPASLLVAAAVDHGPWANGSQHVINGFLVACLVVPAVVTAIGLRTAIPPRPRQLFELAIAPGVLAAALRQDVRSLSTDLPVFVLLAVAGGQLFELLVERRADAAVRRPRVARLLAVLGAVFCVKLPAVPFALVAAAMAMSIVRRGWLRMLAIPAVSVAAWLVRSVILSGYPLYPASWLAFPVDWRVAPDQASAGAAWIRMSGRNLNTNTIEVSGQWIGQWLHQVIIRGDLFAHLLAPLMISTLALVMLWRRPRPIPWRRGLLAVVPCLVAALVWWLTVPHTRMLQGPAWVLAGVLSACALGGDAIWRTRQQRLALAIPGLLFGLMAARSAFGEAARSSPGARVRAATVSLLAEPSPSGWVWPTPTPDLLEDRLASGLTVAVPRVDNSCWNGPLLCTPHPATYLALRDSSDVSRGFRMAGPWTPEWFPNPWIPFLAWWQCVSVPSATPDAEREAACRRRVTGRSGP